MSLPAVCLLKNDPTEASSIPGSRRRAPIGRRQGPGSMGESAAAPPCGLAACSFGPAVSA